MTQPRPASPTRQRKRSGLKKAAGRSLSELRQIAFFDIRVLFDAQGQLRPQRELQPYIDGGFVRIQRSGRGSYDITVLGRTEALDALFQHHWPSEGNV